MNKLPAILLRKGGQKNQPQNRMCEEKIRQDHRGPFIEHELYNQIRSTLRHDYASSCPPPVRRPVSYACAKSPGMWRRSATDAGVRADRARREKSAARGKRDRLHYGSGCQRGIDPAPGAGQIPGNQPPSSRQFRQAYPAQASGECPAQCALMHYIILAYLSGKFIAP